MPLPEERKKSSRHRSQSRKRGDSGMLEVERTKPRGASVFVGCSSSSSSRSIIVNTDQLSVNKDHGCLVLCVPGYRRPAVNFQAGCEVRVQLCSPQPLPKGESLAPLNIC